LSKFVLTAQLQLQAPTNVKQVVSQIQKQLSGVSVNLQMTGSQKAQSQLNQIKNSLDDATKSSSKLGKTFGQQVRRFSALAIATRAVSLFTNTLSSAIQESISFERELIKIAQVTNQTIQQLSFLSKTVSDLSTNLGISSSSLLSVSRILSQAGLSASETSIALSTLAKTELAPTFDNISQTAEGAIAIFNQFRRGAAALEEQLGSINAVAGQFAVESGDLISVVRRTGGVFQAAGGELNELIALFTSVRSTTRESAESIATGLRTIFTRIQRPRTIEFMKKFGVELTDLEGKFVGPYEAVRRLSSALSGLEQGDITFVQIAEELGGFRQIGKVIPLLQQFSVAQEALNVAQRGSGSLARDAATAQQSLAVQITKVKEQFLELIRGVTETPTFQIMAQSALTLASALIKVAESLKPILPIISAIAAVKFAKGMSGFLGGLAGSLSGAKGFNAGGKVHAFATGGMVPGSGNRDTVPAMLTPGEFVMRKSSVQKIGAKNLKKMNKGGQADGSKSKDKQDILSDGFTIKPSPQTHFTHLDSGQTSNLPKGFRKVYTNMGLDLPANWNLDWASNRENQIGAMGSALESYIKNASNNIFETLTRKGKGSKVYGFKGRSGSQAFSLLNNPKNQSKIRSNLVAAISSSEQFDTDLDVNKVLPNALTTAVSKSLSKEDAEVLRGGLEEQSAYTKEGKSGRRRLSKTRRQQLVQARSLGGMIVQKFAGGSKGTGVAPARNRMGMTSAQVAAAEERKRLREKAKAGAGGTLQLKPGVVGGLFLQKGSGGQSGIDKSLQGVELPGFAEGSKRLKASIYTGQLRPEAGQAIRSELKPNITQAVQNAAASSMAALEISPLDIDEKSAAQKAVNKIDLTSIEGYIFEAFTSALTGLQLSDVGATFDYVNPSGRAKKRVGQLFSSGLSGERLLDAKRTLSTESVQSGKSSIANKIVAGIKGGLLGPQDFQKFATGGIVPGSGSGDTVPASLGVGDFVIRKSSVKSIGAGNLQKMAGYATGGSVSESVPALLTPGEFVFPKKKAQQIGYGKLNRMNKVGKYAKGGVVQRFAGGGKSGGGGGGGFLGFGGLTEGLVGVQVALSMLTPTVDENSGTFEKMTASILSSFGSLVSTITLTQTALATFGVQLNAKSVGKFLKSFGHAPKSIKEFFGSLKQAAGRGKGGLGNMIGGFQKDGTRTKGESFGENFDLNKRGSSARSARAKKLVEMRKRNPIAQGGFSKQSALQRKALRPVGGKGILAQLGKKLGASRGIVGRGAGMALRAGSSAAGALGGLGGGAVGAFGASLAAAAGPITAFVTAVKIAGAAISGFRDLENRLQDAIKAEDTATAQKLATASLVEQNWGGAIGGIAAVLDGLSSSGSLVTDTLASIGTAFGGTSAAAIKADVAARISSAKTAKALTEAQKASAEAMKDLENGTISASQALAQVRSFTQQAEENSKAQRAAISTAAAGKSTGALSYGREFMSYASFGYVDSARQRNEKIDAENEKRSQDSINQRRKAIGIQSQASMATARSILSTGGNIDEVKQKLGDAGPQKLRDEAIEVRQKAIKANKEGDTETAKLLEEEAKMLSDEAKALEKSLINLAKEVEKQQKYFAAMNLGLNSATGAAGAFSNAMSNYAAAQEAGNVSVMRSFATLQAGVTSAAAGMDPAVFQKAASEGAKALREFGATKEADKFEANLNAINRAQANAEAGLNSFRNQLKDRSDSGLGLKNDEQKFEGLFDTIVKGSGIGKEMEDQLRDMLGGMDIDYSKIAKGDFSQIEEVFKQLGDETLQQAKAIMEAEQLYQETIRDAAQKRAAAENDFISASRQRQGYQKESREIIASAGGPAFTAQQQREMVVDQYNTGNKFSSRANLGGATAKDIVAQQNALKQRQAEIQNVRLQAAQGDANAEAKLSGERGVSLSNEESQINQQNQELYNSTKQLIDIKRQEVKIIQEKNRLEKQSMESLLAGDIDSFFDAQASQGAIDALAGGGNVADFDADTLYSAFEELKRQAAAGVTEVNGQQLQGPGGLLERAAAATAEARGLDPAQAALVAQKAVGQTPAEQSANNEIQQLAATLPAFGDMAMNSSRVQMAAAEAQRQAAEIQKEAAVKRSQENADRTLPKPDPQQPPQQQPPARTSTPPPGSSPPPAPVPPVGSVSAPPPPSGSSSSAGSTPPAPPSSTADIAAAAAAAASQIPASVNANQAPPTQDPQTIGQAVAQAFSNNARDFASFATAGYVRPSQENESQGVGIRQLANLNPAMALGNMAASNLGLDTQALTSFTSNQLESVSNFGAAVKQFEYIVKAMNTTNGSNNTSANNNSPQALASNNNSAIGFDTSSMNQFTSALSKFNDTILQSISTLQQTKFTVKLEPTNININLTGTSFLQTLTGDLKSSLLKIVSEKIRNLKVDSAGRVIESNSNL